MNENGQVELPKIHAAPDVVKSLIEEIESQGEEFNSEVERIKQEKIEAALKKHKERLNRYKGVNI